MKSRSLLLAALVLAALSGLLYWSNRHVPSGESGGQPSSDASIKLLALAEDDLRRFTIRGKGRPPVDLTRNASGSWAITSPEALAADQGEVSRVLRTLSPLASERLIEAQAGNLAAYGLASPQLEIEATGGNNKPQKLLIGDATPAGNAHYAMVAGDPRLFTIAAQSVTSLDKSATDLRDKRLLTADFDQVSQIELWNAGRNERLTLARNKDGWLVLKPAPYRADSEQVRELERAIGEARMDLSGSDKAAAAKAFASAEPVAKVKVTEAARTQELEVRKSKSQDAYYARSSAVSGSYKVASATGTGLAKGLEDFRNRKLFDFASEDPEKIEIRAGSTSRFLTRAGAEWWGPDGKKLDPRTVEPVVEKLRGLAATGFPVSGFTAATLELIVTSSQGQRVEHVSVSQTGAACLAKRENEAALYELSPVSIEQLLDSAAHLKPAAAPPGK